MGNTGIRERLRKFEIPGRVTFVSGNGGLPQIKVTTGRSTAEIYLHGAHVTGFQKNGEPPLLFLSRLSQFVAGKAIRGGVPVCFPWFNRRAGDVAHGFARITEWDLIETAATSDGGVTVRFRLPPTAAGSAWPPFNTEFAVTVTDQLTMELMTTNQSPKRNFEFETCLHTFLAVGDIRDVAIAGLKDAPFDDFAAGAGGTRQVENGSVLRITKETNRIYPDAAGTVDIHDENLQRTIRVDKSGSAATVVWNPWTTQKLADDFDPAEHHRMVCVESGNVGRNKLSLAPGKSSSLKVVLSSRPL